MQHENKRSSKQSWDKGYYIALILCVAAIGISGYLFTTSLSDQAKDSLPAAATEDSLTVPVKPRSQTAVTEPVLPAAVSEIPQETLEAAVIPTQAALTAVFPVDGAVVQTYSMDRLSYNGTTRDWRTHDGVDFAAPEGAQVVCAADGTVEAVFDDDFLGRTVTVSHAEGYVTRYSNLGADVAVAVGDKVEAGQKLGTVGRTALLEIGSDPHLHFAVYRNNVSVDPERFLNEH